MGHVEISAAIPVYGGKVLCLKRGQSKYEYTSFRYEFPGGKLELGESPEEALCRELGEELHLTVDSRDLSYFMTVDHSYPDFDLTLHCFMFNMKTQEFDLVEHIDFLWLAPDQLNQVEWAPADASILRKLGEEPDLISV